MKTKGAKRRRIPEHYYETLLTLIQTETVKSACEKLNISQQGLHVRLNYMNDWFGNVVKKNKPGVTGQPIKLTTTGVKLLELHYKDKLTDDEILEIMVGGKHG